MEETKVIKKVIRKPVETSENKPGNSSQIFKIMNIIMFFMVFIIFIRGFNIKKTVREENVATQTAVSEMIKQMKLEDETNRQIQKNEILSAFALYSRLDADALKEREEYHNQMQQKYQNMANQYNQGLTNLSNQIKKDSVK
jgi:biopolymer transport protein ExbB/TolQ